MTNPHDPHDGRAGSLVAQALGDALGFLVEGHAPEVCAGYASYVFSSDDPPPYRRASFGFGQYSDDTQLARELALSLGATTGRHGLRRWLRKTERSRFAPEDFSARVAALFANETIVGRGRATEAAARRIIAGVPWDRAGEPSPSAGNGAAMRAGPVGFLSVSQAQMIRIADDSARITHLDMRARAAAVLIALVVRDAIRHGATACSPAWFDALARTVDAQDSGLANGIRKMPEWLGGDPVMVGDEIARWSEPPLGAAHGFERWHGISPFATPSVLYALFAYVRAPADPEEVLRVAVAVGGDVDTVAAMAGAMVGAAVGLGGLTPRLSRWAQRLNDQGAFGLEDLVTIARAVE
ncbi:MAG: ADP-ribosylglycohydrolase family protein [Mycobacterium sp.]